MKRLGLFLDGTWNTLNNNTNVWRLKSLTTLSADQYVYYSQGVGTRRGESARGGITGYGIDEEIVDAYAWLIQNFEDGDEIFIFGFSRGAYRQYVVVEIHSRSEAKILYQVRLQLWSFDASDFPPKMAN